MTRVTRRTLKRYFGVALALSVAAACQGQTVEDTTSSTIAAPTTTSHGAPTTTKPVPGTPTYLEASAVRVVSTDGGRLDWGPNGRIVYDTRTRGVLYDVWIMDPEQPEAASCVTCDVTGLPVGHRGNPEWHPSGDWIVFQAAIKVGNALVTHPGSGVASEIWAIRPDGTDPRELFNIDDPNAFDGSLHPHFNHAGDEIVFARFVGPTDTFELHTLPFDADDPVPEDPVELIPGASDEWPEALYETHGYSHDDAAVVFTGFTSATDRNNDILIADATTGELVDQVTETPDDWDEHAHFQPGTERLLFSSSRDIPDGLGKLFGLDSQADWWVREADGEIRRVTFFEDPAWPLNNATMMADGSPITIPDDKIFAADGAFSSDGSAYAGVLLFRTLGADEWIVIVEFDEVPAG